METIALVSAITALCSVLLGPLVSMWVVDKQTRVSVLSGNRQAWINSLRDQISEFVALMASVHSGNWTKRTAKELDDELKQFILVGSKIKLMLNFKEEDHLKLSNLISEVAEKLGSTDSSKKAEYRSRSVEIAMEIVPLSQSILKREWVRVKQTT